MSSANEFTRRQAADWFARMLAPDADERDRDAFERWCAEDDANADAYAAIAADHDFAALLADDPLIADATRKARIEYSGRAQVSGMRRYVAPAAAALATASARLLRAHVLHHGDMVGISSTKHGTQVVEDFILIDDLDKAAPWNKPVAAVDEVRQ